MFILTTVEGR